MAPSVCDNEIAGRTLSPTKRPAMEPNAMIAKEIIAFLQNLPPETPVTIWNKSKNEWVGIEAIYIEDENIDNFVEIMPKD